MQGKQKIMREDLRTYRTVVESIMIICAEIGAKVDITPYQFYGWCRQRNQDIISCLSTHHPKVSIILALQPSLPVLLSTAKCLENLNCNIPPLQREIQVHLLFMRPS